MAGAAGDVVGAAGKVAGGADCLVGAAGEVVGVEMAEFLFTYTQVKLQIHPNE